MAYGQREGQRAKQLEVRTYATGVDNGSAGAYRYANGTRSDSANSRGDAYALASKYLHYHT